MSLKKNLIFFTALTGTVIGTMHVVNRIFQYISTADNMLSDDKYDYYNWRFGKITYKKTGSGSPVLLIHDLNVCSSSYEFEKVCSKLSKTNTVYSIDLLGCGRSDRPAFTYTNFLYVELITNFIKHIIGEKTDVIASGFSSSFVVMACHNEKELFNKIMLVNPPSFTQLRHMPTRKDHLLKLALEVPIFGTLIYHMIVSRDNVSNLFIEKMYYNPFHVDSQMTDAYYEAAHKGGCYTKYLYSSLASKYMNININHAVKALDNSIYIVEGEAEPNAKSITDEYCSCNPAIEISTLTGTKHLPHVENPENFLEQVKIFF